MLELEPAQEQILSLVQPLASESVPLRLALSRYLAETVTSLEDLPPFDNSAMDGYAVRAEDVAGASPANPVALRLMGQAAAGHLYPGELAVGQCVRLFTGSPLPRGANAVIMQEDTRVDPAEPSSPLMLDAVKPWENVRLRGEDVRRGIVVLQEGLRLRAGHIGLLAALGRSHVLVRRGPILGMVATGSELREPGHVRAPGQIYESNRASLAALASNAGAQPRIYALVADELSATRSALTVALSECDAVVSSGGVSVGEKDLVKAAFQELGGTLAFWKVAVKPGKPFALGTWQGKLFFGLPGNPVSAFVTFLLLVRPALLKFQGASELQLAASRGVLREPLVNRGDRRHFVRVKLDSSGQVIATGAQASHMLHSLSRANGLVEVPANTSLQPGTSVSVLTWD